MVLCKLQKTALVLEDPQMKTKSAAEDSTRHVDPIPGLAIHIKQEQIRYVPIYSAYLCSLLFVFSKKGLIQIQWLCIFYQSNKGH